MSFLRPEIQGFIRVWREVLALGLLIIAGLWLFGRASGGLRLVGGVVALAGLFGLWPAWFLTRHRPRGQDPGLVEITERRLTYLGPVFGGDLSLDALKRVELVVGAKEGSSEARFWSLWEGGGAGLSVPASARGAELLTEALAGLPGIDLASLHRALTTPVPGTYLIWKAGR